MSGPVISSEALRALVSQAVRELVPAASANGHNPAPAPPPAPSSPEAVTIATDTDLTSFVRRIVSLCDGGHLEDLLTGRIRFVLANAARPSAGLRRRIDKGAVTEAVVVAAHEAGERLSIGRRATLTPLARDRARALGIEVVRED